MKPNRSLEFLALAFVLAFIRLGNAQGFEDLPSNRRSSSAVLALLREQGDMRNLVSKYPTLTNRIARGVCLFEDVQYAKPGASTNAWEVFVGEGAPLRRILEDPRIRNRGSQVRIFKANQILQSSIQTIGSSTEDVNFRAIIVEPGDVVILTIPD